MGPVDFSDVTQAVRPRRTLVDFSDVTGGTDSPRPRTPRPQPGRSYSTVVEKHAAANGLDPDFVYAVIGKESEGNPSAVSPKGARGLMQLMPATAARFGVTNVHDPDQNIGGGTKYLRWLLDRYKGDVRLALAGYNAGEGAVDKYKGVPPYAETQDYVHKITGRYQGSGYAKSPKPGPIDFTDVTQPQPTPSTR
jgi:soluble lytic murein transglycosylase-like protein